MSLLVLYNLQVDVHRWYFTYNDAYSWISLLLDICTFTDEIVKQNIKVDPYFLP